MELFDPHGGYRRLDSFTLSTIVYLSTIRFCNRFLNLRNDPKGRLYDQMVQSARSGRANLMEGSERTATSKETEIKLIDVARASLVELLGDYEIWLLAGGMPPWPATHADFQAVYGMRLDPPGEWKDYLHDADVYVLEQQRRFSHWLDSDDSMVAANASLLLCRRVIGMIDGQLEHLGRVFRDKGGMRERMSAVRLDARDSATAVDPDAPACPACGKPMRKMLAKRGKNAGNPFWSCSDYPACKGSRSLAPADPSRSKP